MKNPLLHMEDSGNMVIPAPKFICILVNLRYMGAKSNWKLYVVRASISVLSRLTCAIGIVLISVG